MKVDDDLVRQVIRPRLRESHKGSYGRVLLVGGLYPYGGAIMPVSTVVRAWLQLLQIVKIS